MDQPWERFSGRAQAYLQGRPGYPEALVRALMEQADLKPLSPVADVGSGTGLWSLQLAKAGLKVTCIEPGENMRSACRETLKDYPVKILAGAAERLPLPNCSYKMITAAQAFHWFDPQAFRAECLRVLASGGLVALVWNNLDYTAAPLARQVKVQEACCPKFHHLKGLSAQDPAVLEGFFGVPWETLSYPNDLYVNRQGYLNRILSSSYALAPEDPGYASYMAQIEAIFDEYAQGGVLRLPQRTCCYWARLKP